MNLKHVHFSAQQIKGFLVVRGHRDLLEQKYKEGKVKHDKPFEYARKLTDQAIRKGYIRKKIVEHNETASIPHSQETSTSSDEEQSQNEVKSSEKRSQKRRKPRSTSTATKGSDTESENETRSKKTKVMSEASEKATISDGSSTEPAVDTDIVTNYGEDENQDIKESTEHLTSAETGQTEQHSDIDLPLIQIRQPEVSEENLQMNHVSCENQQTIVTEDSNENQNEKGMNHVQTGSEDTIEDVKDNGLNDVPTVLEDTVENGMNNVQLEKENKIKQQSKEENIHLETQADCDTTLQVQVTDEPNVTQHTIRDVNQKENGMNHVPTVSEDTIQKENGMNHIPTVSEDTIQKENGMNHVQQKQESTEMEQKVESPSEMNHDESQGDGDTTIEYIRENQDKEEDKKIKDGVKKEDKNENIQFVQCKAEESTETNRTTHVKSEEATEMNLNVKSEDAPEFNLQVNNQDNSDFIEEEVNEEPKKNRKVLSKLRQRKFKCPVVHPLPTNEKVDKFIDRMRIKSKNKQQNEQEEKDEKDISAQKSDQHQFIQPCLDDSVVDVSAMASNAIEFVMRGELDLNSIYTESC